MGRKIDLLIDYSMRDFIVKNYAALDRNSGEGYYILL